VTGTGRDGGADRRREREEAWQRRQEVWFARRQAHWERRHGPVEAGEPPRQGPPWGGGRPAGLSIGRLAGIVVFMLVVVALTTAVAGWVIASIFGLIGPDPTSGGPLLLLARLAAVALVVVGLWSVSRRVRRLTGPIYELVGAAHRIEDGDYAVRVSEPVRAPRELRELTAGFNTMAARLEADEIQRRSLLADVSHELRTPLAVVQGNIEALVDGVHPADPTHLAAILEETRVLGRLVDDLRTVTLSESGVLPLHPEPTDIGLLIADVARSFRAMAAAGDATVLVEEPPAIDGTNDDAPLLDVDPIRIREVLSNLVANALRYTPAGGTVTISAATELDGGWLRVEVRDTGPGLAPDVAEHVFDRFARTADSGGSGLGLAIARYLVEAHGGQIGLESRPEGGTTAWFRLPLGGED
jgi:two-component system sensor histidine kinase BaeS